MKLSRFAERARSFHLYQMSSDQDFFYQHPNTVLLGFLGAVAGILLALISALSISVGAW
jgi:hypothetical protein